MFVFSISVSLLSMACSQTFGQDFYIDNNEEFIPCRKSISEQWVNLNENEAYSFLTNSGFSGIDKKTEGEYINIFGTYRGGEYIYKRTLIFEQKLIKSYKDEVMFIQPCILCLAEKMNMSTNPAFKSNYDKAKLKDKQLKESSYYAHLKTLRSDGYNGQLSGNLSNDGFRYSTVFTSGDFEIDRQFVLKLDNDDIYNFYSSRKVTIAKKSFVVGDYDLEQVNQFDLKLMINVFLQDCKEHGISIPANSIDVSFEELEENVLGLSYHIYNDKSIKVRIDPVKWSEASAPKRWYLIYHELGHDVLNLEHGHGGKMMFTFVDRGYSWQEFWDDKEYMLNNYN